MSMKIEDMDFSKEDLGKHVYKVTQFVPLKIVQYVKVDKSGNQDTVFNKWLDKGGINFGEFSKREHVDEMVHNEYNEITTEIFGSGGPALGVKPWLSVAYLGQMITTKAKMTKGNAIAQISSIIL